LLAAALPPAICAVAVNCCNTDSIAAIAIFHPLLPGFSEFSFLVVAVESDLCAARS
jgi:hypothetical protein